MNRQLREFVLKSHVSCSWSFRYTKDSEVLIYQFLGDISQKLK